MRPTGRAGTLMVAAFVLYFFANQTQVGWLYVMAAALLGAVVAAAWLNRASLRGVAGEREVKASGEVTHENDTVRVTLRLHTHRFSAAQLRLVEACPLAAPDSVQRQQVIYVPSLPAGRAVELSYDVTADRRGVHRFAPLAAESRAPFGVFVRRGVVDAPASLLVYPEVRPLRRLDLLDRQLAPLMPRSVAGSSSEVIGTRPYRPGDSPRHIHWRSSARSGVLVTREFADESQPALLLALDCFAHPYAPSSSKHAPFETAVKVSASIADYAFRSGYPLSFAAGDASPFTAGALSRERLLEVLAKVQPAGIRRMGEVIGGQGRGAFVAAVLPYPDESVLPALAALQAGGARVLAILIDPATYPERRQEMPSALALQGALASARIDTRLIGHGDDWTEMLGSSTPTTSYVRQRPTTNAQEPIANSQ
jgi:uncharacterized protein (DUF58 family)